MAQGSGGTAASWSSVFSNPRFRKGWKDCCSEQPFDYKEAEDSELYIYGRQMSVESCEPLPTPAGRMTKEMKAVVKACPATMYMIQVYWELRREENKRAVSLRAKLKALDKQKLISARV